MNMKNKTLPSEMHEVQLSLAHFCPLIFPVFRNSDILVGPSSPASEKAIWSCKLQRSDSF